MSMTKNNGKEVSYTQTGLHLAVFPLPFQEVMHLEGVVLLPLITMVEFRHAGFAPYISLGSNTQTAQCKNKSIFGVGAPCGQQRGAASYLV